MAKVPKKRKNFSLVPYVPIREKIQSLLRLSLSEGSLSKAVDFMSTHEDLLAAKNILEKNAALKGNSVSIQNLVMKDQAHSELTSLCPVMSDDIEDSNNNCNSVCMPCLMRNYCSYRDFSATTSPLFCQLRGQDTICFIYSTDVNNKISEQYKKPFISNKAESKYN